MLRCRPFLQCTDLPFTSECSDLFELCILLWAGFPNPELCQKCSVFRSYKCLCITLCKIRDLLCRVRLWGFFQSLQGWVKRYIPQDKGNLTLAFPTTSSSEIYCHACTKAACFCILPLFQSHPRKNKKESNGVSKSNKQKNSFMPFAIKCKNYSFTPPPVKPKTLLRERT